MKQAKRKKLKKTHAPTLWIGLFMMGLLVILAILAPVICPYDPLEQNLAEFLQSSVWVHREKEIFESEEGKKLLKQWGLSENLKGVGAVALGYSTGEEPQAAPRKEDYILEI